MNTTPPTAPTQTVHPWRATIRTLFALLFAIATVIPYVVTGAGLDATGIGAQVVVVATTITRVLAIPQVNDFLQQWVFTAWLAAAPAVKPLVTVTATYDGSGIDRARQALTQLEHGTGGGGGGQGGGLYPADETGRWVADTDGYGGAGAAGREGSDG